HCPHPVSLVVLAFFFDTTRRSPCATLFPYTTLFRSRGRDNRLVSESLPGLDDAGRLRAGGDLRRGRPAESEHPPGARSSVVSLADRKSTRLNSSHVKNSYAVFCLKKRKTRTPPDGRS